MTLQVISRGAAAGDPSADTLYDAFGKTIANFAELYGIYGSEVEAFTFTTKQDDLAIASGTRVLRWNGAGTTGITGIAAPSTARVVTIVNASTDYLLWLENENTASAAANRLMLPDAFPAFLMPGDTITLLYDLTTARWRVLSWPTRGKAMGLVDFTDFLIAEIGQVKAVTSGTGASAAHTSAVLNTAMGALALSTGTTTTGRAAVVYNGSSSFLPANVGCGLSLAKSSVSAAPDGTETFTAYHGFADIAAGTFTDGAAWELRWTGTAQELTYTVSDNGAVTRSSAVGGITSTNQAWYGVFVNNGMTRADFIYSTDDVSFSLAGSASSGLPSGFNYPVVGYGIIKSAGTTARLLYPDLCGSRVVRA